MTSPKVTVTQNNIVLGRTYSLSEIFTVDVGTPPKGEKLAVVQLNFFDSGGATFTGAPDFSQHHIYVYYGDVDGARGSFSSGTITFETNVLPDLRLDYGYIFPDGMQFNFGDFFIYSLNFASAVFTGEADSVDFNKLSEQQRQAISAGADLYNGLDGSDHVRLPDPPKALEIGFDSGHEFTGGKGNDVIVGGTADEVINGGAGSDRINGGAGRDVAVYSGTKKDYTFEYTAPSTWKVSGPDGRDVLNDVEVVRFSDGDRPLVNWRFLVERGQDGASELEFYEDGKLRKQTSLKDPADCAYDDATPIPAGTYDAVYRTNGGASGSSYVWELDSDQLVPRRSHIQIHGGNTPGDSEGCIVASTSSFLSFVRRAMEKDLVGTPTSSESGLSFYDLIAPITVEIQDVDGKVEQPTLSLVAPGNVADASRASINVAIQLNNHGTAEKPGISKRIDIFFDLKGSTATYGEDFVFGRNVEKVDTAGTKWKVTLDPGKTSAAIPITILPDRAGAEPEAAETIKLEIYDLTVSRKSTTGTDWVAYKESKAGKWDVLEKLFVPQRAVSIKIDADVPPSAASFHPETPNVGAFVAAMAMTDLSGGPAGSTPPHETVSHGLDLGLAAAPTAWS